MLRNALAVLAGFVVWTVVFLGLAAAVRALFPADHGPDGSVTALLPLLVYLVLTALASLGAGYTAARIATAAVPRTVLVLGAILLAVGIAVQVSSWSLAPSWYNVVFLLLLLPLTVVGGRLAPARR